MTSMTLAQHDNLTARINAFRGLHATLTAKPSTPARRVFIAECEAEIATANLALAEAGY